jgi:hypothetical protein
MFCSLKSQKSPLIHRQRCFDAICESSDICDETLSEIIDYLIKNSKSVLQIDNIVPPNSKNDYRKIIKSHIKSGTYIFEFINIKGNNNESAEMRIVCNKRLITHSCKFNTIDIYEYKRLLAAKGNIKNKLV